MPAILAKKLGMTQRFLEDGRVERVTVLEAGPCPVTAIRTHDADGYEAVQLGFDAVREKALTKGELGHLRKADAPPVRTLVEFRDEAGALTVGATVSGPVPLPTEKNVYAVIRSPFKDKDSQEHFEIRTHKRLIDIHQPTPKTVDSLQRLDHLPAGVDIEIRLAFG